MRRYLACLFILLLASCSQNEPKKNEDNIIKAVINENQGVANSLFYERCMSRNKNKGYLFLEEKCKCSAKMFTRTDLSMYEQFEACSHLNIKEGEQIVAPSSNCESYSDQPVLTVGNYVEQYREFQRSGWVDGIQKRDLDRLWKVVSVDEKGVLMELAKGQYYSMKVGETTRFSNSGNYRKLYPDAKLYEQTENSYRVCINPKL